MRKKTLHFFKIVVLVQGVFAENSSEISPFVLFLDKKQLKKEYVLGRKKRYFFSKLSLWYRGVLLKIGLNPFVLFLDKKQLKKDYVLVVKKRYIFSKLSFWYRGFLLKIGPKSHLLFFFRLKKDYVLGGQKRSFFQNCRSDTGGFC